jgi:uncharacterized protein YbaR (Trm112 family)
LTDLPDDLLDILACPSCRGPLVAEPHSLRCDRCRVRYRIDSGIPVLLAREATPLDEDRPSR